MAEGSRQTQKGDNSDGQYAFEAGDASAFEAADDTITRHHDDDVEHDGGDEKLQVPGVQRANDAQTSRAGRSVLGLPSVATVRCDEVEVKPRESMSWTSEQVARKIIDRAHRTLMTAARRIDDALADPARRGRAATVAFAIDVDSKRKRTPSFLRHPT